MIKIKKWDEVLEFISIAREKDHLFSNFYPNKDDMSEWIKNDSFFIESSNSDFDFLIHKENNSYHLYFFLKDVSLLNESLNYLKQLYGDYIFVYDLILDNHPEKEKELFLENQKANFSLHTILQRMSMIKKKAYLPQEDENIFFAELKDVKSIKIMFDNSFDPISERIPSEIELEANVCNKQILLYKKNNKIAGIIVFTLLKKTLYIEHLLTNKEFRKQGIASALIKETFYLAKNCIRFILWVIKDNANAINLYTKFGFKFDNLINYTYTNKK